jgi:23S rRNA (adenine2503-C2)-methyltransferase
MATRIAVTYDAHVMDLNVLQSDAKLPEDGDVKPYVFDLDPTGLAGVFKELGLPRFRADQVLDWVYKKGIVDPLAMTNLSSHHRELLRRELVFCRGQRVKHQVATDGVQKLLVQWGMPDGSAVQGDDPSRQTECVMIPYEGNDKGDGKAIGAHGRRTACISSQIGCAVGCKFCASGLGGLDGDLTAGQIVEQVWQLGALEDIDRISNIVFMGMGEPLANFEQVAKAVRILMADWGLNIGGRKITISTVGLPAQMRRLADLELPVTLAISLHAPDDELRRQLIPWANYVSIKQLLDAGRYYFERTGREITLEYILLGGVNDQKEHAGELAKIARTLRANVNLIRYNEVKSLPYNRPAGEDVQRFQQVLRKANINSHIRASRGRDIAAACGQLRHESKS